MKYPIEITNSNPTYTKQMISKHLKLEETLFTDVENLRFAVQQFLKNILVEDKSNTKSGNSRTNDFDMNSQHLMGEPEISRQMIPARWSLWAFIR